MIRLLFPMALVLSITTAAGLLEAAEVTARRGDDGVTIEIDGQLFARYLPDFNGTPIIWPIIGPTEQPVTRAHPMGETPGEKKDHPHHRSLWFTHGDVNGLSFWHKETIRHREFVEISSGSEAVVVTTNDWLAPDGKRVCKDRRRLGFGTDGQDRWIDFDVTLTASDGPVRFGDTKEGTLGIRVAASMKVTSEPKGRILNSRGETDEEAWGKPAAWVDYTGPVDGKTVGIAILNHPSSFRFPTYWHVRTYGLFAANPFGLHHFQGTDQVDGSHTLKSGQAMTLRYRILLHQVDPQAEVESQAARIGEAFAAYAKEAK